MSPSSDLSREEYGVAESSAFSQAVIDARIAGLVFVGKITVALLALSLAGAARAQVWSLPPSSLIDGVAIKAIGQNAGPTHWQNPSTLGAYAMAGDDDTNRLTPNVADGILGLVWTHTIPNAVLAAKEAVNVRTGSIRLIFLGETAGGRNNFGYTYTGLPAGPDAYTVFADIQAAGASPTIAFGQHVDIPFTVGEGTTFDLWFNAVDVPRGGVYTLFNTVGGDAAAVAQQFLWASTPLQVETWIPSLGAYSNINTYLVSAEDLRLNAGADHDYSDFRFAVQFLNANGEGLIPIPEPAHFAGMIGLFAVAGAVYWRRRTLVA